MPQNHTCAACGTTTYRYADMVGDLCPSCAQERDLANEVNAAFAAAERTKEQLEEQREEREKRASDEAERVREPKVFMAAPDATDEVIKANPDGSLTPRKPASQAGKPKAPTSA